MRRTIRWGLALACLAATTGCYEADQSIVIARDGSAHYAIELGFSPEAVALGAVDELRNHYQAALRQHQDQTWLVDSDLAPVDSTGWERWRLEFAVTDFRRLADLLAEVPREVDPVDGGAAAVMPLNIVPTDEGDWLLWQDLVAGGPERDLLPPSQELALIDALLRRSGEAMTENLYRDRKVTVTLRAPAIRDTNGVLGENGAVTWSAPVSQLLSGSEPQTLRATIGMPKLWQAWSRLHEATGQRLGYTAFRGGVIALLAVLAVALAATLNSRRGRVSEANHGSGETGRTDHFSGPAG